MTVKGGKFWVDWDWLDKAAFIGLCVAIGLLIGWLLTVLYNAWIIGF